MGHFLWPGCSWSRRVCCIQVQNPGKLLSLSLIFQSSGVSSKFVVQVKFYLSK